MANNLTGVIIGWPIEEAGNGRMPKEFVVLARVYPTFPSVNITGTIRQYFKTGRYRKVFYVPFDLEADHFYQEKTDGKG